MTSIILGIVRLGKISAFGSVAAALVTTVLADNPAATVSVNASSSRQAISPFIYGANWADQATLSDLNLAANRRGGTATTAENWQNNAANRAADYYFESLGNNNGSAPSADADAFITNSKAAGAEPMITIPIVDWIAKLGPNREALPSFSIAKYGAQTGHDPQRPDAGNSIKVSDGTHITGNDPNDAYTPNTTTIQQQWVQHLVDKFGSASGAGVKYYIMDNEPAVWPSVHRDIMPVGQTMEQMRDRIIAYAGAVKAADPSAQVVGSEEWGWTNYVVSPYDSYTSTQTDRNAHGGMYYQPWLLQALKANNDATGKRLLDVFSLHYYPQYSEFDQGDSSTAAQLKRNECTRDLWDSNYVSSSWIASSIHLIPRMKDWVNTYYPGTKVAVTEYSWGAENHISGAIAEADVLGIFGREGADLATYWGTLSSTAPIYKAFKIYRNYDGNKSTFGDTSVSATVANPDNLSAFAAERSSDGALTVMVINKYLTANTPVTVNLAGFIPGTSAQVWQLTSANTISRLTDATVSSGSISFSAPAQSITLFVIPGISTAPSNLKAQYAFEGNAQDSSGNANHGTATALTYVAGKFNTQAAQFDGSSSYVSIPRSVADDFTVTMWVKTTDTAGSAGAQWWSGKGLVDGGVNGGGADWGTSIVNGKFVLGIGSTGGDVTLASTVNINDGTWHHVAATRNNSSGATAVYVDGVLSGSGTAATGSRTFPPNLRIGSLLPGSNFLNGTLDDVRLYDRILAADEIAAFLIAPPVAPTGLTATPLSPSRIDLSWSPAANATSYNIKLATSSGGPYTLIGIVAGTTFSNTGLSTGTPYYYVVTAANTSGESATPSTEASATTIGTTSVTLNSIGGTQDGYVPASSTANTTGGTVSTTNPGRLGDSSGKLQYKAFLSFNTSSIPRNAVITSGTLTFKHSGLTGTNPFTTGTCYADIKGWTGFNGSTALESADFQASADATQVTTMSNPASNGSLSSGALNATGLGFINKTGTTQFRVYLNPATDGNSTSDYVSWYTGADATVSNRPALQVTYFLQPTITSPVAYLKFDESSGTTAADSSGNGWQGTLVNGPTWVAGKTNNAVSLSGSAYVTLPTDVVNTLSDFTISAWVNVSGTSVWTRIFDFGTGTGVYMFLTPKNGINNKVRFAITNGSGEQQIDGAAALPTGAWTHVAVTLSGSTGTLYVNGTAAGTNTAMTLKPSSLGNTTQNYIGKSQWSNDPNLTGTVDDFRIYNRALSVAEVSGLAVPPTITSTAAATGTNGSAFSYAIQASNSPTSYGAANLPSGLGVNTGTGLITGAPTVTGTFTPSISAVNASGTGSATLTITVLPLAPVAPTGLVATGSNAVVTLVWNPSSGATSYNVLRSVTSGGGYALLAGGTTALASYSDTGLGTGVTYFYVVTAKNLGGTSGISNEAGATTYTAVQAWRMTNFGTTSNTGNAGDNADPDGDGMTNAQEFAAGTNPNDRTNVLKATPVKSSNDMLVSFPSVSGKTYRVERSDTLQSASWTTVQDNIAGTGSTVQVTDSGGASQPRRFYRVVAW